MVLTENWHCDQYDYIILYHSSSGTFGEVEHVILVGVGGGVPHYNDDNEHVRMGDIVVSKTDGDQGPMYVACTGYER